MLKPQHCYADVHASVVPDSFYSTAGWLSLPLCPSRKRRGAMPSKQPTETPAAEPPNFAAAHSRKRDLMVYNLTHACWHSEGHGHAQAEHLQLPSLSTYAMHGVIPRLCHRTCCWPVRGFIGNHLLNFACTGASCHITLAQCLGVLLPNPPITLGMLHSRRNVLVPSPAQARQSLCLQHH